MRLGSNSYITCQHVSNHGVPCCTGHCNPAAGHSKSTLGMHAHCIDNFCVPPPVLQTVYEEMEVDAEMQNGLLPGALALSSKFLPTVKTVATRTAASAQHWISKAPADAQVRGQGPVLCDDQSPSMFHSFPWHLWSARGVAWWTCLDRRARV